MLFCDFIKARRYLNMKPAQMTLLKTARFLPLFITQFLGAFNDNVFKNALVILITYRLVATAGFNSQILITFAAGIFILPFFLFSAIAGQLADKYEKSRLISIIKLVEIILMVIAALGFYFQNVTLLMTVLFLLGTQAAFFGPLKYAILPEQLKENELIAGNGLVEAGTFIAILLGTILGGILILHVHGEYIISAIILVVAIAGWAASLFIPQTSSHPITKINYHFIKETITLMQYAKKRWDIFLCILGISWFWLVGATFLAEFPVFVKDILYANEHVVTFFLAVFSIGLAIGSLLCNVLLKGKIHATYVPLAALGITLFTVDLYFAAKGISLIPMKELMSLSSFLYTFMGWHITCDLMLIAICGGIYTVPLYAILQSRSEKAHCAQVIASNNVLNALFMVLAAIFTMLMLKQGFSVSEVFLTIAVVNGAVAIYICKLLPDILVKSFFHALLKFLYRVKINGLENYRNAGERVVIIANHTSFIDALLISVFLPDKLTFAVNSIAAKKWWVKIFLKLVNAFPLDPTNPMAIKSLIEFVETNKKCVIFPEGRLTMTGNLMKMYEGPSLIADKAHAVLLPIRIDGAQLTPFSRLRGKVRIQWMPTITITIFPTQQLNIPQAIKGRQRRQKIGYKLYDVMTKVMFESSDYKKTLFTSLLDAKVIYGKNYLIMEDTEREPITYKTFITRCFILSNIFEKTTKAGEAIGLLLPNAISNMAVFFALQACCRIPAMLNYSAGAQQILTACHTAKIKNVYTSQKFIQLAKLEEMIDALTKSNINIIYLENIRSKISFIDKLKGSLMAQFPRLAYKFKNRHDRNLLFPDGAAVILFTSGSEGTPKGVVLSHQNIQANRYQLSACVDFNMSDKIFNALPMFHSFGLTAGTLLPILSGVKVFFYPSPLHYRIIPELAYDTNATILFGTDTFLSAYAKYAHPYDFYSVRYIFAGAEKLKDETRMLLSQKFGIRIFEGYGATETSPVLAVNTPLQNKVGTVGRLLPGIQYRLNPVPGVNEGGVLMVSGPNIMKGYLLASQPGVLVPPKNGWYDTGDIVAIDERGFVTIKGRLKRFAKIAGEMVSLILVESLIEKLWPGYQHAVVNMPDSKKGEQLILVTTYSSANREEIVNYAKSNQISEIAIPKKIVIIQKMPLLGTGKIDYTSIKELI